MKVSSLMIKNPVSVDMDVSLGEIRDLFGHASFHHLLVEEQGQLVGIISDRDMLKWLSPFVGTLNARPADEHLLTRRAHQIMTRQPVSIGPDESLVHALKIMDEKKLSCLPVVDAQQRIVGILSARDLMHFFARIFRDAK